MPQDLYKTLHNTTTAVIAAYSSPSPWNPSQIWATRTDTCLHTLHPKDSLPGAFHAPADKAQHIQSLEYLGPVFERFELEVQDRVIDVQTRTVVVRLKAVCDFVGGGGGTTEFMWFMEMDENGERVKRVEEFLDKGFLDVVMARAKERVGGKK